MKTLKAILRGILIFVAVVIGVVVVLGFIPFGRSKTLANGATVRITHAPVWLSLGAFLFNTNWWPHCTITYQPKSGKAGKVVFWEDFVDWPFDVFLAPDGHSLLCLYDYDISVPLFKFDTERPFDPSLVTYNIKRLVCASPWRVEEPSLADWVEVQRDLPPPHNTDWIGSCVSRSIQDLKDGQPPVPFAGEPPEPVVDPASK